MTDIITIMKGRALPIGRLWKIRDPSNKYTIGFFCLDIVQSRSDEGALEVRI